MNDKNIIKLWNITGGDENLHSALVHAYYHLLRWERGMRFTKGGEMIYGRNEYSEYWENYALQNLVAYNAQLDEIQHWEEYLTTRALQNLERRMEKMFRTPDEDRPSYPKAEAAAKRAKRKMRARYN